MKGIRGAEIVMVALEELAPSIEAEGFGIGAAITRIRGQGVPVSINMVVVLGPSPVFYTILYAPLFHISGTFPEASTFISGPLRLPVI